MRHIAFFSRILSVSSRKYSTFGIEFLDRTHFRHILKGSKLVVLLGDMYMKYPTNTQYIGQFKCTLQFVKGPENVEADSLFCTDELVDNF